MNANVSYIPEDTRWPYVQTWFFSVQRELPGNSLIEVGYTGNHSLRLPIIADYNQALPNAPGGTLGIQPRRPNQAFGAITWVDPAGIQTYNGFSARFEHRFSHGLYFLNSFTWSKALGRLRAGARIRLRVLRRQSAEHLRPDSRARPVELRREVHQHDEPGVRLPFGRGRKFGSNWNRVVDAVLGGWEINTINTANTGTPLDVFYTPGCGQRRDRPHPGLSRRSRHAAERRRRTPRAPRDTINHYYGNYTFTIPPANAPFGNAGRNAFRGPSFWQWDLGVNKSFRITERARLQFRSEFFNVLNHTNFAIPDSNISDAAFGTIRSTFPARQIQFALKLMF